jgi:hypothetical protein
VGYAGSDETLGPGHGDEEARVRDSDDTV